jgi:mono/diheme cytochrome c family protein
MSKSLNNIKLIAFLITGTLTLTATPDYGSLDYPTPFSSQLPYDVNIEALRALSDTPEKTLPPYTIPDENIPPAQRWFDIFSWQAFLALNWPALPNGEPNNQLTLADSKTPRVWEYYVDATFVYRKDGAAPLSWKDAVTATQKKTFWMAGMSIGTPAENDGGHKHDADTKGGYIVPVVGGSSGSLQAFTGPMIDQEGKWVRYQAAMNEIEYDYLVENKLYNLEGQIAYTAKNQINFPANRGTTKHGAMEIKMSWKQLTDEKGNPVGQYDPARFLVRKAHVVPLSGEQPYTAEFGLVGMHIAAKTESSPTWIWATFEQVDNTNSNDLEKDRMGRPIKPTFFNTTNPTIPVNTLAPKNAAPVAQYNPATGKNDGPEVYTSWDETLTTNPTQTTQVLPIPGATAALNMQVQAALKNLGSVFQYYELIGTQWPAAPSFPGFTNGVANQPNGELLPSSYESIVYKIPGKVVPVFLVNTTMETFFQAGNQPAGPVADDYRLPAGLLADPNTIFATESCAGCHFSAGAAVAFKKDPYGRYVTQTVDGLKYRVPIFGQNAVRGLMGDGDYSWLMQLRAQSAPYTGTDTVDISTVLIPNNQKICPAK